MISLPRTVACSNISHIIFVSYDVYCFVLLCTRCIHVCFSSIFFTVALRVWSAPNQWRNPAGYGKIEQGKNLRWPLRHISGIVNHRQLDCLFNSLFILTPKKTSNLCINGPLRTESTGGRWYPSLRVSNAGSAQKHVCNRRFGPISSYSCFDIHHEDGATDAKTGPPFHAKCWRSGGRLNKKDRLTGYGDPHVKDKTS